VVEVERFREWIYPYNVLIVIMLCSFKLILIFKMFEKTLKFQMILEQQVEFLTLGLQFWT
jgi:hypothetical protein